MIGWLDCTSGVSGDKFLGALLDAGLDPQDLTDGLDMLDLPGWAIEVTEEHRRGFRGIGVNVIVDVDQPARDWCEIRRILEGSRLEPAIRDRALDIFARIASAEAHVHGIDAERVHFHEVGAVDSIIDIVGACIGLSALGIERLVCSTVTVGWGTIQAAHGTLPVPAPATALLLEGVPVTAGPVEGELTTPTGAALVRVLADSFGGIPAMVPRTVGHGAGSRDPELPNILRLIVGDPPSGASDETVVAIRAVIDHRTPEELAHALDVVRDQGALDAWQTPVAMKKGRSGVEITVLAAPEDAQRIADAVMRETGTLGVRREFADRRVAPRAVVTVETSMGPVRFKVAFTGEHRSVRPEADDVARLASEHGEPAHEIAQRLIDEAQGLLGD